MDYQHLIGGKNSNKKLNQTGLLVLLMLNNIVTIIYVYLYVIINSQNSHNINQCQQN